MSGRDYSAADREALLRRRAEGIKTDVAADELGINRRTARSWVQRAAQDGTMARLRDEVRASSPPRSLPKRIAIREALEATIIRLTGIAEDPTSRDDVKIRAETGLARALDILASLTANGPNDPQAVLDGLELDAAEVELVKSVIDEHRRRKRLPAGERLREIDRELESVLAGFEARMASEGSGVAEEWQPDPADRWREVAALVDGPKPDKLH